MRHSAHKWSKQADYDASILLSTPTFVSSEVRSTLQEDQSYVSTPHRTTPTPASTEAGADQEVVVLNVDQHGAVVSGSLSGLVRRLTAGRGMLKSRRCRSVLTPLSDSTGYRFSAYSFDLLH